MSIAIGLAGATDLVTGWLERGVPAAGALALLVCAGLVVVGRRRRSTLAQDGLVGATWVLGGLALAAGAAALVGVVAGTVAG
ncbi:hypothetical protein ACVGVM_02740 [Pseudonocardia bannensis]|uniref:Uncharacterized protein n=1 Tax=Pseudonocardia bannensis TaxID=630973 RepID=A0A848DLI5_9PSEU|nr:hypothetical protein [Pseudonocardia bannensis]NMH93301.1 hypothetical protein [Pseudonocardia bannensis]